MTMNMNFTYIINNPYLSKLSFVAILTALLHNVTAQAQTLVDCPLRDEPYSIDSPLIDILLKPQARAIADHYLGSVIAKLPSGIVSKEAPTHSAIIGLRDIAARAQLPADALVPIANELARLTITDADRRARCARYDTTPPKIQVGAGSPRILLFEKITGYRDGPSVEAANTAIKTMAKRNGWAFAESNNGAAISATILRQFDAVVWNNVSGDVLTLSQRQAFENYINNGGGYIGIHGSAGDPNYLWTWYVDQLIGAHFIGHPVAPQFQYAKITIERNHAGIGHDQPPIWSMNDEWYSFKTSPRKTGAQIIATLDESTYNPVGHGKLDLRMGDHPIVWIRCVGSGRSFYSSIGHKPQAYSNSRYVALLEHGISWASGQGQSQCQNGKHITDNK